MGYALRLRRFVTLCTCDPGSFQDHMCRVSQSASHIIYHTPIVYHITTTLRSHITVLHYYYYHTSHIMHHITVPTSHSYNLTHHAFNHYKNHTTRGRCARRLVAACPSTCSAPRTTAPRCLCPSEPSALVLPLSAIAAADAVYVRAVPYGGVQLRSCIRDAPHAIVPFAHGGACPYTKRCDTLHM